MNQRDIDLFNQHLYEAEEKMIDAESALADLAMFTPRGAVQDQVAAVRRLLSFASAKLDRVEKMGGCCY